ncbi:MAG: TetR/AcrR family transcriptional regulator [Eubacteriales bacterium]
MKDDEKQNSIKNAVVKLILEEGFHGTSISKIAKAAGVSPATVYIYYENKEEMMRDIYQEYAEEVFDYIQKRLTRKMTGEQLIDVLIRGYYHYITENREIFNFIEQFSTCPSLQNGCNVLKGPSKMNNIFLEYKEKGALINYRTENLWALLFYPIKAIASHADADEKTNEQMLDEMISIIQKALL